MPESQLGLLDKDWIKPIQPMKLLQEALQMNQ